jgi:hypothetical protein
VFEAIKARLKSISGDKKSVLALVGGTTVPQMFDLFLLFQQLFSAEDSKFAMIIFLEIEKRWNTE